MADTILIVDDEPVQRRLLEAAVARMGMKAIVAAGGDEALAVLGEPGARGVSVVVLDLMMPGTDGLGVLKAMRERQIALPVIVQTAQGGIDTVVGAMRAGAFDFVVKPVSPDRLQTAVANALKIGAAAADPRRQKKRHAAGLTFDDIICASPRMKRVLAIGEKAARSNIPVLIEGESGVGKELIARAIQGSSERRSRPFVTVNCGALPENLVESILFGHEKGAFTGASEKHVGKFEEANGGTLFLDEIGELPADIQVKLLRALQEGEIDPIGARKPVKVDIRLISATNRDLQAEVNAGRFREDLFYRLNVLPLTVPPLRDRREDVPLLLSHFTSRFAREENRPDLRGLAPGVGELLAAYDWPGNIRQLENAVFRAVVLAESDRLTIEEFPQIAAQIDGFTLPQTDAAPLPAATARPPEPETPRHVAPSSQYDPFEDAAPPAPAAAPARAGMLSLLDAGGRVRPMDEIEAEAIRFAIDHCNGRMTEVARCLRIGRSTLYRKLRDYGLDAGADQEAG